MHAPSRLRNRAGGSFEPIPIGASVPAKSPSEGWRPGRAFWRASSSEILVQYCRNTCPVRRRRAGPGRRPARSVRAAPEQLGARPRRGGMGLIGRHRARSPWRDLGDRPLRQQQLRWFGPAVDLPARSRHRQHAQGHRPGPVRVSPRPACGPQRQCVGRRQRRQQGRHQGPSGHRTFARRQGSDAAGNGGRAGFG